MIGDAHDGGPPDHARTSSTRSRPQPMAKVGADVVVAHMGLTTKGAIGATTALTLEASAERVQAIRDAAVAVKPDIIVLCHGGPIAEPEDAEYVLSHTTGVAGFFGASSMERLPTEIAITENMKRFKRIGRGGGLSTPSIATRKADQGGSTGAPQGRSPRPVPRGRDVPDRVDVRDREAAVLGLRRPALPQAAQPDVRGHRRLVAVLRPHVPPLRHAVRDRLDLQERQRLPVHGRHPGRGRPRRRHAGVQLPRPTRSSPRTTTTPARSARTWAPSCPSTASSSRLVARAASSPRCSATSTTSRACSTSKDRAQPGRGGRPPRGRHRHARPPLEDPLDAELRAAVSATLNLRAVMEKTHGKIDEVLLGRLQNSANDRNWDKIEALWEMKEEVKADAGAGRASSRPRPPPRSCRPSRPASAAAASSTSGSCPYQKEFGWHAVWSHEFIFPTLPRGHEPGHPARPRPVSPSDYDYPSKIAALAGRHRRPRPRRSSRGSRARRSRRCAPPTRSTSRWRRSRRTTTSTSTRAPTPTSASCSSPSARSSSSMGVLDAPDDVDPVPLQRAAGVHRQPGRHGRAGHRGGRQGQARRRPSSSSPRTGSAR